MATHDPWHLAPIQMLQLFDLPVLWTVWSVRVSGLWPKDHALTYPSHEPLRLLKEGLQPFRTEQNRPYPIRSPEAGLDHVRA